MHIIILHTDNIKRYTRKMNLLRSKIPLTTSHMSSLTLNNPQLPLTRTLPTLPIQLLRLPQPLVISRTRGFRAFRFIELNDNILVLAGRIDTRERVADIQIVCTYHAGRFVFPFRYEHRRLDIRPERVATQNSRGEAPVWDGMPLMIDEILRAVHGDDADGALNPDFRSVLIDELVRLTELVQPDSAYVWRVFPVAEASDVLAFCFLGGEHFQLAPAVFVAVFYADSLDFGVVILEVVLVDGFAVFVDDSLVEVSDDVVVEPVAFVPGSFDESPLPL